MNLIKRTFSILLIIGISVLLGSCGKGEKYETLKYGNVKVETNVSDGTIAENNKYKLDFISENACVLLTDKQSGDIWSTIPYEYLIGSEKVGKAKTNLFAPMILEYVAKKNKSAVKVINGYTGILKNGKIETVRIENGIRVFYFFKKIKICIPLDFTINENGLSVSIVIDKIAEESNLVYKVGLLPYLCSAKNNDDKENYLVIPSGNGALMYTDNRAQTRKYEEQVYGDDLATHKSEQTFNTETVRMAFFGAKDGNRALCGMISKGAASASICASAGDETIGYSSVYPTFTLRGSDISSIAFGNGNVSEVKNVSDEITRAEKFTVNYCPLNGEDADYSGIALCYRNLMSSESVSKTEQTRLTVKLLCGLQVDSLMLGIPYKNTTCVTSFSDALKIVKEITNKTGKSPDVVLSGFGTSGINIGEIAGGYKFYSKMGSKKDIDRLFSYCDKNDINIYFDFDIVNMNKSGSGFSKTFDAAKSPNSFTAYQSFYSTALKNELEEAGKYVLLKRGKLSDAVDKLIDFVKEKKIKGVGVSTLSNRVYSDYDSDKYYVCNNIEKDVEDYISRIKKKGTKVLVSSANDYASFASDKIIDAPAKSSMYNSFDEEVPLYQMVFKGVKGISINSINTVADEKKAFLQCMECGTGLAFTLSKEYDSQFATSIHSVFATSNYNDNLDKIIDYSKKSDSLFKSVGSSKIVKHMLITSDVRSTEFENGVKVIVNYSDSSVTIDEVSVEPMGFVFKEG